jgi:hypothetical protein
MLEPPGVPPPEKVSRVETVPRARVVREEIRGVGAEKVSRV